MRSKLARGLAICASIVVAIAIVWHPIVFGGYTISTGDHAHSDAPPYGADVQPVMDPHAGAAQDEPWLALIGRSLARGDVPLVNMRNGLGAPLVESLQPGVFYPLNVLLVPFGRASSAFFDAFELLHVLVYALGLYVLLRHYARSSTALCITLLVALSGVTSQHVNMVHFRTHAWMPWMACAAVAIARGDRRRRVFALLVVSHVCAVTCGALQEAFVSTLAVGAIFAIECWASARPYAASRTGRAGDAGRLALAFACSTAVAAVAYLPYIVTRGSGEIQTATNSERVLDALPPGGLASFFVPGALGFYPHLFTDGVPTRWMSDFSTLGCFVCIAGVIALLFDRGAPDRRRMACFALLLALGLAKMQGLFVFDFLRHAPFLNEILVVKYHAWIFDVAAIVAAIGLEALLGADARVLRRSIAAGLAIVLGSCAVLLLLAWRTTPARLWSELPDDVARVATETLAASAAALVIGAVLLIGRPRGVVFWLAGLVVVQAACVRPDGWKARRDTYAAPVEAEAVARTGGEPPPRVLSLTMPNQNLIHDFESVGVFDPISSTRLSAVLGRAFELQNPQFIIAPKPVAGPLSLRAMRTLRFLGVELLFDYEPAGGEPAELTAAGVAVRISPPVSRVWFLDREFARSCGENLTATSFHGRIDPLLAAVERGPHAADVRVLTNGIEFRATADFRGVLVAHQIFLPGWEFENRGGRPFMQSFPSWDVELVAGRTYRIEYVPLGLRTAAWISACGVLLAIVSAVAGSRRASRSGPSVEPAPSA